MMTRICMAILTGGMALTITACNPSVEENQQASKAIREHEINLTIENASQFAQLALKCVGNEFPNKLDHVMNSSEEVLDPVILHPAFYGCFDWHSSVHGHWMLVKLLKNFPDLPEGEQIRSAISENLSGKNLIAEVNYLDQPNRKSFERTYGWAWLLKLSEELQTWDDPDARLWSANLASLSTAIVDRYIDFLPRQYYPIRRGVHPNTAFGISFALDYARVSKNDTLESLLTDCALKYYLSDSLASASWEPDGDDFFSPSLIEADLMRRVLDQEDFIAWFDAFLPGIKESIPENLLLPATVTDRSDPKIVHLDGLNLSRAWCMFGIARSLPAGHEARQILTGSGIQHALSALPHITTGNYEGEHWLASFAVYMLMTYEELKQIP